MGGDVLPEKVVLEKLATIKKQKNKLALQEINIKN